MIFTRFTEWVRMKQRGERRIAPRPMRGRVYARERDGQPATKAQPKPKVTFRVFRAINQTWEE